MSIADPIYLPDIMAVSTLDTRGLNLYPALYPTGDAVASITSVIATRADGGTTAAGDLIITPIGSAPPWISANKAGVDDMAINWWQGVGTLEQIGGSDVVYNITVSFTTTNGRSLAYTAQQLVTAIVG